MAALLNLAILTFGIAVLVRLARPNLKDPSTFFTLGLLLSVFSGSWNQFALPLGLDKVLIGLALVGICWKLATRSEKLVLRDRHVVLSGAALFLTVSAVVSGSLQSDFGLFSLLDRGGLIPYLAFVFGPVLYRHKSQRDFLLVGLVGIGGYLATTSILEMTLSSLVWPTYIADPGNGIHLGRARGPFLEAAMNGLTMIICAAAAVAAAATWQQPWARRAAVFVAVMCGLGCFLTLTRAVWIAAAVTVIVGLGQSVATRKYILPGVALMAVVSVGALVAIPQLADQVSNRSSDNLPVFDRLNTNNAAIQAGLENPVFGIGFEKFRDEGNNYMEQADGYPLTGSGLIVHNVFLSNWAELGIVGSALWLAAFIGCVVLTALRRKKGDLEGWRAVLLASVLAWFVVSMLGPTTAAAPTLLMWALAGLVNAEAKISDEHPNNAVALGRS